MSPLDGKAKAMMTRLVIAGVPKALAYAIGHHAYASVHGRRPNVPEPIVSEPEIIRLVRTYEEDFPNRPSDTAGMLMVWRLCSNIFGPNREKVFFSSYPDLDPDAEGIPSPAEVGASILRSASRYFPQPYDPGSPAAAQVAAFLVEDVKPVSGHLVFMHDTVCFFNPSDFIVDDPEDGDPILISLDQISSFRTSWPAGVTLDRYTNLPMFRMDEGFVRFEARLERRWVQFLIAYDGLDDELRAEVERDLRYFFYVLDREVTSRKYRELTDRDEL